jgi:hypothetical protein
MENRMQKSKKILLPVSLCLILTLTFPAHPFSADRLSASDDLRPTPSPSEQIQAAPGTATTLYLPCVLNNYNSCAFTNPSPFGIEIAGLSDFIPPAGMSKAEADRLRQQQLDQFAADLPVLVKALQDSGAGWTSVFIDWSRIQLVDPAGGTPTYDWSWYDGVLGQVASSGVKMYGTIASPPAWASVNPNPNDPQCSNRIAPAKLPAFLNFLTALVNRYKAPPYNIHIWELMNEPDTIDGVRCNGTGHSNYGDHGIDYATLVTQAVPVIKTEDPSAKTIMGGIAYDRFYLPTIDPFGDGSPDGLFNRYFSDDFAASGAAASLDALSIHYFHDYHLEWERWTIGDLPRCGSYSLRDSSKPTYGTYGLDVVAKASHFQNRLITCYGVNKPLWITETGFHGMTNPGTSDWTLDNQARYVFTVYARSLSFGVENITWYALKINPSVNGGDYQGLLYDSRDPGLENQPKPAFYAYQTLARELTGYHYSASVGGLSNAEAYVFTNMCDEKKIIAWYNETSGYTPLALLQASSAKLVYRPYNNGSPSVQTILDGGAGDLDGAVNESITLALTLEPVIIQSSP